MRKSYVTPSILLLPMQIGPNAGVSDNGGMKPIDAKEGAFYEEDFDMSAGWSE
ncbi:hypothetical protein [Prevotella sp. TCVGH]|uniref:hypothetical protein n=1 Tax=Prevotella sp. TCVGH TaxID=2182433 RepID=UPI00201D8008|nr:hypothetical protein [Prevotella sp. TCVGH]